MIAGKLLNLHEGEKIMKPKKVLLWGQNNVLGEVVETFLVAHKEWDVVRIMEEESNASFIEQMEVEHPDVVIVYEAESARATPLPCQLVRNHPEIKVITMNLEDNFLDVYTRQDKHRVWVQQVSDLFSAINE